MATSKKAKGCPVCGYEYMDYCLNTYLEFSFDSSTVGRIIPSTDGPNERRRIHSSKDFDKNDPKSHYVKCRRCDNVFLPVFAEGSCTSVIHLNPLHADFSERLQEEYENYCAIYKAKQAISG